MRTPKQPSPTRLPQQVIDHAVKLLPETLRSTLVEFGPRAVVGGGFLRTAGSQVLGDRRTAEQQPKDIDIFVRTTEEMHTLTWRLKPDSYVVHYAAMVLDPRNSTHPPIQVIAEWDFGRPEELIGMFDFSVIQAVLWWTGTEWEGAAAPSWEDDVTNRQTDYSSGAPNPTGSLRRIRRLCMLGYHVRDESLAIIAIQATEQARAAHDRTQAWRGPASEEDLFSMMLDMFRDMVSPPVYDWWPSPADVDE